MYNNELLSVFCILFFCILVPLGFIAVLLKIFLKPSPPSPIQSNILNITLLIQWLKEAKIRGLNTVDELLQDLEIPRAQAQLQPKIIENTSNIATELDIERKTLDIKNKEVITKSDHFFEISSANLLLYLGAFLIIFSIFVLVAFNWQNYTGLTKSIILVLLTFAFYGAGVGFHYTERLKDVSRTFLYMASVSIVFTGIGLYNFSFKTIENFSFWNFWLIYSFIILGAYILTLKVFKIKNIFYLIVFAIYSILTSLSFSFTTDTKIRIVILCALNLLFYLLIEVSSRSLLFNKVLSQDNNKFIILICRVFNYVLDFIIFFTVLANLNLFSTIELKLIGISALLIPTIFELCVYIREKFTPDLYLSILSSPLKLLLITWIFNLNAEASIVTVVVYVVLMSFLSEMVFNKIISTTFGQLLTKFIAWSVGGCISAVLILNWIYPGLLEISNTTQILSLLLILAIVTIPEFLRKNYSVFSFTILYAFLVILRVQSLVFPDISTLGLISFFGVLLVATLGITLFTKNHKDLKNITLPFLTILIVILSSFSIYIIQNLNIVIGITLVALTFIFLSILYNKPYIRLVSIFLFIIVFYNILETFRLNSLFNITNNSLYPLFSLIPVAIYCVLFDLMNLKKKVFYVELIGFLTFLSICLLSSIGNKENFLIVILLTFFYSIYSLFRFKKNFIPYAIFLTANTAFFVILNNFLNLDPTVVLMYLSCLWIIFTLIYLFNDADDYTYANTLLGKNSQNILIQFGIQSAIFAILTQFILFFTVFQSKNNIDSDVIITCFSVSLLLLLSSKLHKILGFLSGFGLVLIAWHLAYGNSASIHFYSIPLAIYFFIIGGILYYQSGYIKKILFDKNTKVNTNIYYCGLILEVLALSLEFFILLIQSLSETGNDKVINGLVLIAFSIIVVLYSLARKERILTALALLFLLLELIIRLYVVILLIPWWLYLGLIGLCLIGFAIYITLKLSKK